MPKIGIIGGSGLYNIEGLKKVKETSVATPFGKPSDNYITGTLDGFDVVFLPRHGRGHRILPSELNFRANIYGMKKLGVEKIISVSACGSLKEGLKPLDFVIPNQFVDRAQGRKSTFFGNGIVAHVGFADPVCPEASKALYNAAKKANVTAHLGGTYLNMEGPAFSTKAESNLYRAWGMDIIGMTNMQEAKLARESEICYATLAAVTDYDCWREAQETVTVDMIISNLLKNVENSKKIIRLSLPALSRNRKCSCSEALKYAIVTDRSRIPVRIKKDLKIIIGKYIK